MDFEAQRVELSSPLNTTFSEIFTTVVRKVIIL